MCPRPTYVFWLCLSQENNKETDSDDDERNLGLLDSSIAQLLVSDTEYDEFDEFVEEE